MTKQETKPIWDESEVDRLYNALYKLSGLLVCLNSFYSEQLETDSKCSKYFSSALYAAQELACDAIDEDGAGKQEENGPQEQLATAT